MIEIGRKIIEIGAKLAALASYWWKYKISLREFEPRPELKISDVICVQTTESERYWVGHNKLQISTKEFVSAEKKSDRDKKKPHRMRFYSAR